VREISSMSLPVGQHTILAAARIIARQASLLLEKARCEQHQLVCAEPTVSVESQVQAVACLLCLLLLALLLQCTTAAAATSAATAAAAGMIDRCCAALAARVAVAAAAAACTVLN
jgi:hypothetical protein